MKQPFVPISGSLSTSQDIFIGFPDPKEKIEVRAHSTPTYPSDDILSEMAIALSDDISSREYLIRSDLEEYFGIPEADLDEIKCYFEEFGISIKDVSRLARNILLEGELASFEEAFHTQIGIYKNHQKKTYLNYSGYLYLPPNLASKFLWIRGINPEYHTERRNPTKPMDDPNSSNADNLGYNPLLLAKAYNFPKELTGRGQCIGIVELGGKFLKSDLTKFCRTNKIRTPRVVEVGDLFGTDQLANNAEVTLDTQVVAALAQKAKIVIYNAHNIVDAMNLVLCDNENRPNVISISWAASENFYQRERILELNHAFFLASLLGITIVGASGDDGALNLQRTPNVSLPASHPLVLACGGTMLEIEEEKIKWEAVWNERGGQSASGGGFSKLYPRPQYQYDTLSKYFSSYDFGRGVPDVAANAGIKNGYTIFFNGKQGPIGGTSASTPLWASLIALLNEGIGKNLGFVNNLLFPLSCTNAFNQILYGNNQVFNAGPGWNPCTGLGSPNGEEILNELRNKLSE